MTTDQGTGVEILDDVDTLVDEVLSDPSKADDVKAALKRRVFGPQIVDFRVKLTRRASDGDEDAESDLWDNVPV